MAFNPGIVKTEAPVEFKLEFKVKVTLNGTDPEVVKERLHDIAWMAIEMGDVIGETTAEVDDYAINVFVVEEEVVDPVATFEKIKDEILRKRGVFPKVPS